MIKSLGRTLSLALVACAASAALAAGQTATYPVTLDTPLHGTVKVDPPLPADGKYPAGTVVTVTAVPDAGYAVDSAYYSAKGRFGQMFYESMASPFKVTIDQDKHLGASFIERAKVDHLTVTQDVVYAKPGVKALKYDVFAPKGAKNLPGIVIIHGGGWTTNTEDIMRGMARELTRSRKYVVFSLDYRWAGKGDGDAKGNTMANLVEDVYGGIAHIQEHAAQYGLDPARLAVTGDSAGGHLSAAAITLAEKIGKGGFGKTAGVFEFMPTYLPKGKTVEQVRTEMMAAIKAAAPSYGVFGGSLLNHYSDDPAATDLWKDAIAPQSNIPNVKDRAVPQYLLRGTLDSLIKDEAVKSYVDALVKAGQRVEYVQVGGASHAFFDWKPDERTKATFAKYGVFYCSEMEGFFNSVFYPVK
jgi:acetyl esterase